MTKKNFWRLVKAILLCEIAGIIGSFFTSPMIDGWYAGIKKPPFNPPNWIFAPVWTILFVLMGVSLYIIWSKGEQVKFQEASKEKDAKVRNIRAGIKIFLFQLLLNIVWSFLFFGLRNPLLALIEIIILWFAILFNIYSFYNIDKKAAYFLVPYILWVSFAVVLNFTIVVLNF